MKKYQVLVAASLLTAIPSATGFASARYYRTETKPAQVNYNFDVRNAGHSPIYYRYGIARDASEKIGLTAWTRLDDTAGFNARVDGLLFMELSAHSDGSNPTLLRFDTTKQIGPRSIGPRTCYIAARVVHPEYRVVVTPQNPKTKGGSISTYGLPLGRNLAQQELETHVVVPPHLIQHAEREGRLFEQGPAAAGSQVQIQEEGEQQAIIPYHGQVVPAPQPASMPDQPGTSAQHAPQSHVRSESPELPSGRSIYGAPD
jgi:hypothetical protein